MSTYEYVEGDFPAIVSQEIWDKAQAIRESRMKPALVSAEKTTHSKRDSRDIWVNKLRCSCGSSYRKNKWHTKLDGKTSYGYQCYNQPVSYTHLDVYKRQDLSKPKAVKYCQSSGGNEFVNFLFSS